MGSKPVETAPWRMLTKIQLESFERIIAPRADAAGLRLRLVQARDAKAVAALFLEIQRPVKRRSK